MFFVIAEDVLLGRRRQGIGQVDDDGVPDPVPKDGPRIKAVVGHEPGARPVQVDGRVTGVERDFDDPGDPTLIRQGRQFFEGRADRRVDDRPFHAAASAAASVLSRKARV